MNALRRIRWANVGLVAALVLLAVAVARTVSAESPPAPAARITERLDAGPGAAERAESRDIRGYRRVRRPEPRPTRPRRANPSPRRPRRRRHPRPRPTPAPALRLAAPPPAPATYYAPPPASEFGFERP